jgi:hypothetical protein
VRAVGPTLATFGITNALAAPTLTIIGNGPAFAWTGSNEPVVQSISTVVGAFPLPAGSKDAALFLTLNPGSYIVEVGGGAGEVLLEIYHVE